MYEEYLERTRLKQLQRWLTFSGISGFLLPGFFLVNYLLPILCVIAIVFSVYLLRTLIQLKRKGWVMTFGIMVGFPLLLLLIPSGSTIVTISLVGFALIMFYIFCWVLRMSVAEWLSDLNEISVPSLKHNSGKNAPYSQEKFH